MKFKAVLLLFLFHLNSFGQDSIVSKIRNKSNPILFSEFYFGGAGSDNGGLWLLGYNLNYQFNDKDFLTARFSGLLGIYDNYTLLAPTLILPFSDRKETQQEYALLYGKRWVKENVSFSISSGVSHTDRVYYKSVDEYYEKLNQILPENANQPYDIREVIEEIIDSNSFLEVHKDFAENIVVGFARLAGRSIGIVANQPAFLAGVLDINSSTKAARFVRFCDCFNIPLLVLEDVPGFLPGTDQEWNGIIVHGAKLLYALSEATVPKVTVITRKAYGGAYIVMNSKHLRGDNNYAWINSEIAVMGAEGAAEVIFRQECKDPEKKKEIIANYKETITSPFVAASRGYLDDIIKPQNTRWRICKSLKYLRTKSVNKPWKKHDNLPL